LAYLRLYGEPGVVEQAGCAGARLPGEDLEKIFAEVEEAQWKLGAELTQDGIECNIGSAAGCKIFGLVKNRPMVPVRASEADNARARQVLTETVLPNWVKRCGARCGDTFNEFIAPISGVRYRAP
jgi:hypothetical protein